ncbi:MAG: hypothetical protein PHN66_03960, partial [Candidatus Shapirobacteria bacterium]|nr:hypothetical protein [Candidatus Shapirobacteria bacterium]
FKRNSESFWKLVQKRHSAFILLCIIAQRARRFSDENTGLETGESWIGDFEKYNSTRSKYRTDLKWLVKFGFITTRKHDRGTAAKLIDSTIFDINPEQEIENPTINKNYEVTNKREFILTSNSLSSPEIINNLSLLAVHENK